MHCSLYEVCTVEFADTPFSVCKCFCACATFCPLSALLSLENMWEVVLRYLLIPRFCAFATFNSMHCRKDAQFVDTPFTVSVHAPLFVHCMRTYFSRMCEKLSWLTFWLHISANAQPSAPSTAVWRKYVEFVDTQFSVTAHAPPSVLYVRTYFSRMCEKLSWATFWFHISAHAPPLAPCTAVGSKHLEFLDKLFSVSAHAPPSVLCKCTYFSRMCEKLSWLTSWFHIIAHAPYSVLCMCTYFSRMCEKLSWGVYQQQIP